MSGRFFVFACISEKRGAKLMPLASKLPARYDHGVTSAKTE